MHVPRRHGPAPSDPTDAAHPVGGADRRNPHGTGARARHGIEADGGADRTHPADTGPGPGFPGIGSGQAHPPAGGRASRVCDENISPLTLPAPTSESVRAAQCVVRLETFPGAEIINGA